MEISNSNIKLTYDESEVLVTGLYLEKAENKEHSDDLVKIQRYVRDHCTAMALLAESKLRYINNEEPSNEDIKNMLRQLGSQYITIRRSAEVDRLIPSTVSNFLWYFNRNTEGLNSTQAELLELASKMCVEMMVSIDTD